MIFPWVGLFEQIRLADVYVHYDDVQFSKGGFSNRVQIKTANGIKWLTVPLKQVRLGQKINEVQLDDDQNWRASHLEFLKQSYRAAPYVATMLELVCEVYESSVNNLSELAQSSIDAVCNFFDLNRKREFVRSSKLNIPGHSTERVLRIIQRFDGGRYVTGHGARDYFDHELLERNDIRTEYIDYSLAQYPQQQGDFTPYVSILDLIANVGRDGGKVICSQSIGWRSFLERFSIKRSSA